MPKGLINIKTERKCKIEKNEIIITSEKDFSKEINTRENNYYINKNSNKFIFSTPISSEKGNYFPSTPKKSKSKENDDYVVRGRDLSIIFELL